MNLLKLEQNQRPIWTVQSIARTLGIQEASARVMASRYTKSGILMRLKNNLYLMKSQSRQLSQDDVFYLSNIIQTPSYISFMTALSYYGATTQITRNVLEAVSPVRTQVYESEEWVFNYSKIDKDLYFGFIRVGKFFIATKEKALLDCLYFSTMGRYSLDVDSIDFSQFSAVEFRKISKKFPERTQALLSKLLKDAGLKKA